MSVEIEVQSSTTGVDNALRRLSQKFRGLNREVSAVGTTADKIGRTKINTTPAVNELRKLNTQFERTNKTVANTTQSIVKNVQRAALAMGALFAGNTFKNQLNQSADAMTDLGNRIALVTGRGKEMIKVQDELFKIAANARVSVEGATDTFNRFGRALRESNYSTQDFLKATDSIQKALAISGGSAESAKAAIFQLGQGLASGTLRGQELNSVMEQADHVARAIAAEMGIAYGELRSVAEEGRITADVVMAAMLNQAGAINAEFENINKTSAKMRVTLGDALTRFISAVDRGLGLNASTIRGYEKMTEWLNRNNNAAEMLAFTFRVKVLHAIRDAMIIGEGLGAVLVSSFRRLSRAIPAVILPMRTLADDMEVIFVHTLALIYGAIGRFSKSAKASIASMVDESIMEGINALFRSENAYEARDALYHIAGAIETVGLRWYNFGNRIEVIFRRMNIGLLKVGIYLGFIDQRLIRLRYHSIERIGDMFKIASYAAREFLSHLFVSEVFIKALLVLHHSLQLVSRVFEAMANDVEKLSEMSGVTKALQGFADRTKAIFRSIYMFVVGNSVWPDMINEMINWSRYLLVRTAEIFLAVGNAARVGIAIATNKLAEFTLYVGGALSLLTPLVAKIGILVGVFTAGFSAGGILGGILAVVGALVLTDNTINALSISASVLVGNLTVMLASFLSAISQIAATGRVLKTLKDFMAVTMVSSFASITGTIGLVLAGIAADIMKLVRNIALLFTGIYVLADVSLKKASAVVSEFSERVVGFFEWIYMRVIGNSYWRETMEGVVGLASTNLRVALGLVGDFSQRVRDYFRAVWVDMKNNPADAIIHQFKALRDVMITVLGGGLLTVWATITEGSVDFANVIGSLMLSAIVTLFSKKTAAQLLTLSAYSLAASTVSAVLPNIAKQLSESGFVGDLVRPVGQAMGQVVKTLITQLPILGEMMFDAGAAFVEGFMSNFGFVGRAISTIFDKLTLGIGPVLLAGLGFAALTGKLKTIKGAVSGLLALFFGTKNKKGGVDPVSGLLGSILFGRAGAVGLVLAVTTTLGIFTGLIDSISPLATLFGVWGLAGYLLFGRENSVKLLKKALHNIANTTSLLFFGRNLRKGSFLDTLLGTRNGPSIKSRIKKVVASIDWRPLTAVSDFLWLPQNSKMVKARQMLDGLFDPARVLSFRDKVKDIMKSIARINITGFASSLIPTNFWSTIVAGFGFIQTAYQAMVARMSRISTIVGGANGVMGRVLFGAVGYGALLALIISLFTGQAQAADSAASAIVGTGVAAEMGLAGLTLFGLAGPDRVKRAVKAVVDAAKARFSTVRLVASSATGAAIGQVAAFGAGFLGRFEAQLLRVGAAIAGVLTSAVSLWVVAGAAAVGLLGYLLFGEGNGLFDKLSHLGSKIRDIFTSSTRETRDFRKEISALVDFTTVGGIKIDLIPQLNEADLTSATPRQLNELRKAALTANKIFERNQQVYQEEGELSRAEQRETKYAIRMVENAVNRIGVNNPEELAASAVRAVAVAFAAAGVGGEQPAWKEALERLGMGFAMSAGVELTPEQFDQGVNEGVNAKNLQELYNYWNKRMTSSIGDFSLAAPVEAMLSSVGMLQTDAQYEGVLSNDLKVVFMEGIKSLGEDLKELRRLQGWGTPGAKLAREDRIAAIEATMEQLYAAMETSRGVFAKHQKFLDFIEERDLLNSTSAKIFGQEDNPISKDDSRLLSIESVRTLQKMLDEKLASGELVFNFNERSKNAFNQAEVELLAGFNEKVNEEVEKGLGENLEKPKTAVEKLQENLQKIGVRTDYISSAVAADFEKAQTLAKDLADRIDTAKKSGMDSTEVKQLETDIAAAKTELLFLVGDTAAKVELVSGMIENSIPVENILNLSDETLQKLISYGRAFAQLKAMLATSPGADPVLYSAAMNSMIEEMEAIIGAAPKTVGKDKAGGGGGKTWWQEFTASISSAGFNLEEQILGNLPGRLFNQLIAQADRYKAAQEAINKSTAGEVELRRKAFEEMRKAREEIARTLMGGNLGSIAGALDGLGFSIDALNLAKRTQAEIENILDLALRLQELQNKLNNSSLAELGIRRGIALEIEAIRDQLDRINEEEESIGATMKDSFRSAFSELLKGASSLRDFFHSVLDSLSNAIIDRFSEGITDIIFDEAGFGFGQKIDSITEGVDFSGLGSNLSKAIGEGGEKGTGILSNLFGKLFSGDGGGLLGGIFNFFGSLFGGLKFFAGGGYVSGPGGPRSDSIPAMLSNGEFVVNAAQTKRFLPLLAAINENKAPAFASGGQVGPVNAKVMETGSRSGHTTQEITIAVTGDVSRQTRQEIVRMIPQITNGVNATNREKGVR